MSTPLPALPNKPTDQTTEDTINMTTNNKAEISPEITRTDETTQNTEVAKQLFSFIEETRGTIEKISDPVTKEIQRKALEKLLEDITSTVENSAKITQLLENITTTSKTV